MMMEKILILSDIHGNKEALQVVEKYYKRNKINKIICLGDTVGYGIDFEWCLNWLYKNNSIILLGNHESMVSGITSTDKCSDIGKKSVIWSKVNIKQLDLKRIQDMKYIYRKEDMLFTHAGNRDILKWNYIREFNDIEKNFINDGKINFYGHTHRAQVITNNEVYYLNKECNIDIDNEKIYYINPGSVGQSRGKKTRVSFIILEVDGDKRKIKYYLRKYKSYRTYKKIIKSSMGECVANYLLREKWRKLMFRSIYNIRKTLKGDI